MKLGKLVTRGFLSLLFVGSFLPGGVLAQNPESSKSSAHESESRGAEGKLGEKNNKSKKLLKESPVGFGGKFKKGFAAFLEQQQKDGFFSKDLDLVDLSGEEELAAKASQTPSPEEAKPAYKPVYDSDSPESKVVPPDQDAPVAINKDAPAPAIGLVTSYQSGDLETAAKYAEQWVRYQQNYIFTVRELTGLIGKALVKEGEIDDEDWVGVEQVINYEMAKTRAETGVLLKPRHEVAMQRVKADPKNEVEVYYFFTLNCSWCRQMAEDIERIWRLTKSDKKIKMVALTLGPTFKDWIREYRDYTGLSLPIFEGGKFAKGFKVGFVPALVVVTPNNKRAYLKTGKQSFERIYEFIRRAQGLPATITPEVQTLAKLKVGKQQFQGTSLKKVAAENAVALDTNSRASMKRPEMEKF